MRTRTLALVIGVFSVSAVTLVSADTNYLLSVVSGDDATEVAAGFSETSFARLRAGMSVPEVIALLGPPLEVYNRCVRSAEPFLIASAMYNEYERSLCQSGETAYVMFSYSRQRHPRKDFKVRDVVFSPTGQVMTLHSYYHID
jgi:hypothetical protein